MKTLQERVDGFVSVNHGRVLRDGRAYADTARWAHEELTRKLEQYRAQDRVSQYARLIRDEIDNVLRRYQNYCVKERIGGHYRQKNLAKGEKTEFEHVLPLKVTRDLLIFEEISIDQALHTPTCILSKANHHALGKSGHAKTTPSNWYFFWRYRDLGIEIETHNNVQIDLATWTLGQHWDLFIKTQENNHE